ncbi:MAG: ribulose-phosphate 3-epimerase [Firmicutes bacterium]|nr:ribulose-phosphate 3-epimerase [Bacillota bacterium]
MILSPSILAADFGILGEQIKILEKAGADWLHIDVMDGNFVPNITFAMPVIKSIRKYTDMFFDVHLMIDRPERYINDIIDSGADGVTIHIESTEIPDECIRMIKARGKKAAVTLKPATPVEAVIPYIEKSDMTLVMTVEPGMGGQKYMYDMNEKVRRLREIAPEGYNIEVDGGVTLDNLAEITAAGANVIVAGTCVFKGDIEKNVKEMMRICGR